MEQRYINSIAFYHSTNIQLKYLFSSDKTFVLYSTNMWHSKTSSVILFPSSYILTFRQQPTKHQHIVKINRSTTKILKTDKYRRKKKSNLNIWQRNIKQNISKNYNTVNINTYLSHLQTQIQIYYPYWILHKFKSITHIHTTRFNHKTITHTNLSCMN